MRLYQRGGKGVYYAEFSIPGVQAPVRKSTHERDRRQAWVKAAAMLEAETRQWSRQELLFASRDNYRWERACADWHDARMREGWALATIEIDGQNLRYLAAAVDGAGTPFFRTRLLRDIDGMTIGAYVTQQLALGLTPETVAKRVHTLSQILTCARARNGTDGRPLLAELPPIPALGRSRDPDGWGRALSREEWEGFRLALPTTGETAPATFTPGHRGGRAGKAVDQRGWAEICLWTAQHADDVNSFTPDLVNLAPVVGPSPRRLPPFSFVWRNTKGRRRTRGKVREQIRRMPAALRTVLERLERARGLVSGVPVAGRWLRGNIWRDMQMAARRAGIAVVQDDRGKPHLVSSNDLRRTAATWLAEALAERGSGPDKSAIEKIAEFLGHRGIDVARAIYDRAAGTRLDQVTDVLDALAGPRVGPKPAELPPADIVPIRSRK